MTESPEWPKTILPFHNFGYDVVLTKEYDGEEHLKFSLEKAGNVVEVSTKMPLSAFTSEHYKGKMRKKVGSHITLSKKDLAEKWEQFLATNINKIQELIDTPIDIEQYEKEKFKRACFIEDQKNLLQQIYDPRNGKNYLKFDGWKFDIVPEYEASDGTKYKPLEGEEIERNFINLASAPGEFSSVQEIVHEIVEWSKEYSDIPDWFREFAAYFCVFTYVYDIGNATPYLRFMGDTGCGKSRCLNQFGKICYNSIQMSGAATIAPFYRIMDKWSGTPIIEESDVKGSGETNEIIKIFNCGIERHNPIMRCDQDNHDVVKFFDPFCPKVFAARHPFQDMATEARCLSETLSETKRKDIPPLLPPKFYEEAQEFRNKLVVFRLQNYKRLNREPENILPENLEPRLKQMGLPLLVLFNGREDPAFKRFSEFLLKYQRQLREARANSMAGLVVAALIDLLDERLNAEGDESTLPITCKNIAEQLKIQSPDVSREIRALGMSTESRHAYVTNKDGERKRKSLRAIVCSDNVWGTICSRYLIEGKKPYDKPKLLDPSKVEQPTFKEEKLGGEGDV